MNPAFDKCIPVQISGRKEEVSLSEALIRARDIEVLLVPLSVQHALVNFMSAALKHALSLNRLKEFADFADYFKVHLESGIPADVVNEYFAEYGANFDMFNPPKKGYPFLQPCDRSYLNMPDPKGKIRHDIGGMMSYWPSGNNKIHHFSVAPIHQGVSVKDAFLLLVSFQTFFLGSGLPKSTSSFPNLPSRSCPVWTFGGSYQPEGKSLYETLFFNADWTKSYGDAPSWALSRPEAPSRVPVEFKGPMHRATFPHHWIILSPPGQDGLVKEFAFPSSYKILKTPGDGFGTAIIESTTKKGATGRRWFCPRPDSWTKRHVLVSLQDSSLPSGQTKGKSVPPLRLQYARDLVNAGDGQLLGMTLFYQTSNTQHSVVKNVIEERFCVPVAAKDDTAQSVMEMAECAMKAAKCLFGAVCSRGTGNKIQAGTASDRLMSTLGTAFEREYLSLISNATDSLVIRERWKKIVRHAVLDIFDEAAPDIKIASHYRVRKHLNTVISKVCKANEKQGEENEQ